jgi:hypothetical protein
MVSGDTVVPYYYVSIQVSVPVVKTLITAGVMLLATRRDIPSATGLLTQGYLRV